MTDFQTKRQLRIERLEDAADKARREANALYNSARQAASAIPFGQPILIGHHSEKRDRRYRDRFNRKYEKSFELSKKADRLAERAAAAAANKAIFSDDPEALTKLEDKIAKLEKQQELMRTANKHFKRLAAARTTTVIQTAEDIQRIRDKNPNSKVFDVGSLVTSGLKGDEIGKVVKVEDHGCGVIRHLVLWPRKRKPDFGFNLTKVGDGPVVAPAKPTDTDKDFEALLDLGFSESFINKALEPDMLGRIGFPDFALTNNSANIRRLKERLVLETRKSADETTEKEINGVTMIDNVEENRLQLMFPGKPSQEIRTKLKAAGFRFSPSNKAWQRHRSSSANWQAEKILNELLSSDPAV